MKFRILIVILLLVGLAILGIGIYPYIKPSIQTPGHTVEAQPEQAKSKSIFIGKERYIRAKWDKAYGHDADDIRNAKEVWMSRAGSITYNAPVGQTLLTGDTVEISAKVSSELENVTSNDVAFSSDVTLFINGVEQSTKNVIPDNGIGEVCTWKVPSSAFKRNEVNEVTFAVKANAFYKNGIVFYSPIELKFKQ